MSIRLPGFVFSFGSVFPVHDGVAPCAHVAGGPSHGAQQRGLRTAGEGPIGKVAPLERGSKASASNRARSVFPPGGDGCAMGRPML